MYRHTGTYAESRGIIGKISEINVRIKNETLFKSGEHIAAKI
jgi:hypothetical protein